MCRRVTHLISQNLQTHLQVGDSYLQLGVTEPEPELRLPPCPQPCPGLTVVGGRGTTGAAEAQLPTADARALQCHALLGLEGMGALLPKTLFILEQGHHLLDLLAHVHTLIFAIAVDVLEIFECLDGVEVLPALVGHPLRACLEQVVQQRQRLVDMPPVLATVIEPPPQHAHDLGKCHCVEGQISNLGHERARRTPGVIAGGLTHLDLCLRVVVHDVLHLSSQR